MYVIHYMRALIAKLLKLLLGSYFSCLVSNHGNANHKDLDETDRII